MMKKNYSDAMPIALRDNREYATKANRKRMQNKLFTENSFPLIELKEKSFQYKTRRILLYVEREILSVK